jgi:EAL domain-containing protein (putative c-di-GMP-specific phosphodiesterase class I)
MGVSSFSELEGLSVLEILSSGSGDIKQMVRDFGRGQFPPAGQELEARSRSGERFPVRARFDPTQLNGEACVQMMLTPLSTASAAVTAGSAEVSAETPAADVPQPVVIEHPAPAPLAPKEAEARADENDPLTGLLRRSVFMHWLDQRLDELPDAHRGGLLFMQPDAPEPAMREARVAQMDACTRALARVIASNLGSTDMACRFGDYAFAMLAQRDGKHQLRELAGTIQQQVHEICREEPELGLPEAFSVGFVLLDPHAHDAESAVVQARAAWFEAKDQGNAVARYKPERSLGLDVSEEASWAQRLRYALDNEDFYTAQYSITNLEGETEGLVENRTFLHEDDADLPYDEFQAGAELTGMASQIDRAVIPGLFRVLANSGARHIINVSSSSLQDFSFANWLRREMASSGVDGSRMVLQWPAAVAREHPKAARRLIEELQPSGCKFSLSGVDGEVRNRATIGEFEPNYVRLDPQLTNNLHSNQETSELTKQVVREARAVNALTIASDVSNSNDLAILWQCGVKLVSGDFLQSAPRVIGI